jgi:hypothetical protein
LWFCFSKIKGFESTQFVNKNKSQQWVEVGRTEIITDNHNPTFVTAIEISFLFEERQPLKVEIYDADDLTQLASLAKQDFLGILFLIFLLFRRKC